MLSNYRLKPALGVFVQLNCCPLCCLLCSLCGKLDIKCLTNRNIPIWPRWRVERTKRVINTISETKIKQLSGADMYKHLPRPKSRRPQSSPLQTLKQTVWTLFQLFLLIWHLWTMDHLHSRKMLLFAALLSAQPPPLPPRPLPPCSLANNTISYLSLYIFEFARRTNHWFGESMHRHWWPLLRGVTKGVLLVPLHLSKVKFRARHPAVDVLDVIAGALKVSGGVVWAGDEDLQSQQRGDSFSSAQLKPTGNRKRSCSCPGLMLIPGSSCPGPWVRTGQKCWQTSGRWASGGPEQAWSPARGHLSPLTYWRWQCICPPLPHCEQRRSCRRRCLKGQKSVLY